MQRQLHHYVLGALAFGFVVTWTTLGFTTALVAGLAGVAAANLDRLAGHAARRDVRPRKHLAARPLRAEDDYQLVPDDPSLIISTSP